MKGYVIVSEVGKRAVLAPDPDSARQLHYALYPDDPIIDMYEVESI